MSTSPLDIDFSEPDEFSRTMVIEAEEPLVATPDTRLQPGSVLRDRYLIQSRVSGGNMGVVYRALDRHLADADGEEAAVAIKVLSPQFSGNPQALRALQQEAAKGRCLTHPNIVRFIDLDREEKLYFIVMEWLDGESLADLFDNGDAQPDLARSIDIVRQVGEALAYAHRRGVVHADIKPGNVMLLPDGTVKLVDFGIARVRQRQDEKALYDSGMLKAATPAYSSMQVLTGDEPTVADDVFSLACLAYRLIAGHRVFGPRNAAEAAEAGMEPQRPQGISDAQWKALRKGLAYSRVSRQATPMELVDCLMGMTTAARPPAPAPLEEELLAIPNDAIIERRFESRPARWPYVVFVLILASGATLALRPDWRAGGLAAVADAVAWVRERVAGERAIPAGVALPPGAGDAAPEAKPGPADAAPVTQTAPAATDVETAPAAPPVTGANSTPADGTTDARSADPLTEPAPSTIAPASAVDVGAANVADPGVETGFEDGRARLVLGAPGEPRPELELVIAEDGDPLTIELYRWFGLAEPLLVRVDEVGFSGSSSPRATGDYMLADGGVVNFDAGQRRADLLVIPRQDAEREADRQVTLLLRDYYNAESVLAEVSLRILDDEQRDFETDVPVNSVAFATGRIAVRERDPAAQIDVVRHRPDQSALSVSYQIVELSASEGQDFFAPGRRFISFGPGQRNARLLIPLVQDTVAEGDETFVIELDPGAGASNTISRIAVIIRDDDIVTE